jgi:hypothetical protein
MRDVPWNIRLAASLLAVLLLFSLGAPAASAATNLTNSLTGFTANSTQAATQTALAAAGLGVTSTLGFHEDPEAQAVFDPTIQFDANGANFGGLLAGDGGRNFIRTAEADYANVSFVAEVTWVTTDMLSQAGYFGLGSADYGSFRIADWGTPNSAIQLFLEVPTEPEVFVLKNDNTTATFDAGTAAPGLVSGTNRLRMSYDWFQKKATFAVDVAYAGGAFVADVTTPAVNVSDLYGPDGWPTEPARVYFGGDDGTTFKDLQITVSTPSMRLGDFNADGNITSADWTILRTNQLADLSGKTFQEAYFLGDVTADLANDHADFAAFKEIYDAANGVGAFAAMTASVPEPSSAVLLSLAALLARPVVRRAGRRSASELS